MDTAIVELDALPDAVGPAAQDNDLPAVGRVRLVLGLAKAGGLVGRIHIGRDRLEFGGAAVDPLVHRIDAELAAQIAHFLLARRAGHGAQRIVQQAGPLGLRFAQPARDTDRPHRQRGKPLVRKAHRLEAAHFGLGIGQAVMRDHVLFVDDRFDLAQEPRVVPGDRLDILDAQPLAEGLRDLEDALGGALAERGDDLVARHAFQLGHPVEPVEIGFETAQRLLHRFGKAATDRHDLTDRFHRGRQFVLGALELLEREARDLGHDIVDRRFETGGRRAGDLVLDLVERIAHRQLGGDARDREAGRLRCQRRRA